MRTIKCDICGKLLAPDPFDHVADRRTFVPGIFGILLEPLDVCERCQIAGSRINWVRECTAIWKEQAERMVDDG